MSGGSSRTKTISTRLIQALALTATFGILYGVTRFTPEVENRLGAIAGVGFLLLAGTLLSELFEVVGLPHLSGYLMAGILGGPHILHLVEHDTVEQLSKANKLALALIALAGGAELRIDTLRRVAKSLAWATLVQTTVVLFAMTGVFMLLSRWLPFTQGLPTQAMFAVALLWGVLCITRSPSACLGILSQTRAKGPVATFSLAYIMLSDVVVVIVMAAGIMLARPLVTGGGFSIKDVHDLGHEILGGIAVGTTFGLLLAIYLRLVGKQFLLVLLATGFGASEALSYIHLDPLLTFMSAGFVVQNLSNQGDKLIHEIEQVGSVVFVVFFATAGAHLDVPMLQKLWPIALALCFSRTLFTVIASQISGKLAGDEPALRRWGWSSLVSQAGLALGVGVTIERAFPSFGAGFRSLTIAAVAINEMIGPVLFKFALDRSGETDTSAPAARPSLAPPPEVAH